MCQCLNTNVQTLAPSNIGTYTYSILCKCVFVFLCFFLGGGDFVCFSYPTSPPRSPIGSVTCWISHSNIGSQTSAVYSYCYAEVWQPMVAQVSLFQVAEVPTNRYDYTLLLETGYKTVVENCSQFPERLYWSFYHLLFELIISTYLCMCVNFLG